MSNETKPVCPQCSRPLPANAPAGLCPNCLMAVNMATQTVFGGNAGPGEGASPPPAPEQIAAHFPNFEILECMGRGGMGVVYKARQKSLNRLVALKLLAPEREKDASFGRRFASEAETLARLNHPGIVTIYDFGQADGLFYLVMELVDGVTLGHLLQAGRIAPREALAIVPQICDALQYAHDQGVVHRDIKPENILLDRRGRVKVADFGLAKLMRGTVGQGTGAEATRPQNALGQSVGKASLNSLTVEGQVMGTPSYMAPEQREHPQAVDHRADIYSLGIVFYQMLTGELPGQKIEPPSRRVALDVRLDEVVLRALEREPERRYQQASVMKTKVENLSAAGSGQSAEKQLGAGAVPWWLRWAGNLLGLTGFLFVLMFILADGFPPFWKQPPAVQVELASMVLMLAGLLTGWKRAGMGAILIVAGWTIFGAAEQGMPPWAFSIFLIVAALYGWRWWMESPLDQAGKRRWLMKAGAGIAATGVVAGLLLLRAGGRQVRAMADKGYEKAVASGPGLKVTAGPNRFEVKSVIRNDLGGKWRVEDGLGTALSTLEMKTQPESVRLAEWLDLVNLAVGIESREAEPGLLWDPIEIRVFDHKTRKLLGGDENGRSVGWGMNEDGVLQIRAASRPLPEEVDVWFRMASYPGTEGRVLMAPHSGSTTNLGRGRLILREIREGQWGYRQNGRAVHFFENPTHRFGTTLVLEWEGEWKHGRYQICVREAKTDRNVFVFGAPHFIDFSRQGTPVQVLHFNVPRDGIEQVEARPFGGRHTFYFNGVRLPRVERKQLAALPVVDWPLQGTETATNLGTLAPVNLRVAVLRGSPTEMTSLALEDPELDVSRFLAEYGPAKETNQQFTLLYRVEGLGQVNVSVSLHDRQGHRLDASNKAISGMSVSQGGGMTAGQKSYRVGLQEVSLIRFRLGR